MNIDSEIACVKCGSSEFRLTRTTRGQILAECSKCGHPHIMEGGPVDGKSLILFWTPEEEEGTTDQTKETLKAKGTDKQKISKEIEEKSVEELTNEMIEFIEKESLYDAPFYEISRIFWSKKGLDFFMFSDDPDIALKRLKLENSVKKKLGLDQVGMSLEQLKKDRDLLDSLKSKIVAKARKDNKKSLTHDDIELFLMENEEALPQRLKRMLHKLVNLELKQ